MRWRVRRSDGCDTVIEASDWEKQLDGTARFFCSFGKTETGVASFAPAGWLWIIRDDPDNPVEVGLQPLSPEFAA